MVEVVIPAGALPKQIGCLTLGERRSDGERLCSHCHSVPAGHPLYWPERMGEYPDDMDPLCLAHAIEQAVDDNGWCEKCTADEFAYTPRADAKVSERERVALRDRLVNVIAMQRAIIDSPQYGTVEKEAARLTYAVLLDCAPLAADAILDTLRAGGEVREALQAIVDQTGVGAPGTSPTRSKWARYPSKLYHAARAALAPAAGGEGL